MLGLLVGFPFLALLPALVFAALYKKHRRLMVLYAAIAWLAYVPWEYGMKLRLLCSGECNIRVDLLLLYPILACVTVGAAVAVWRARRDAADEGRGQGA